MTKTTKADPPETSPLQPEGAAPDPAVPEAPAANATDPAPHAAARSQPLEFSSDRGSSRSIWVAALITLGVVAWMGSGFLFPSENGAEAPAATAPLPVSVAVRNSTAEEVTLFFSAEGQAQPDRDTMIRADPGGEVAEVFVTMGATVTEGAPIARLRSARAEAELARARQEVTRTGRDLENAETLLERGVATVDRVVQARSALTQAEAQLTAAEEQLADMLILAPFAGRIEALEIAAGETVQAGAGIARIVDISPLTVSFQVPQQSLTRLQSGQPATVTFITGDVRDAVVSFVGTSAVQSTRTFLAEVSLPNEDGAIAAGISAEISIPTARVSAHFLSPSIVSLSPEGRLGVKTVDDADVVQFQPIEIVRAEIDGIWVIGLPDTVRVITVGQGYVNHGDTVRPQPEEPNG